MPGCPICEKEPTQEIWPFCSAECLHADPTTAKDPDLQRRIAALNERDTGAGGPGGMTPTVVDEKLSWYLAGGQDEAAHRDGLDGGPAEPACSHCGLGMVAGRICTACEVVGTDKIEELEALPFRVDVLCVGGWTTCGRFSHAYDARQWAFQWLDWRLYGGDNKLLAEGQERKFTTAAGAPR